MPELEKLLISLRPVLGSKVELVYEIIKGIYSIGSGGVTMKNISRWAGKGAGYRNIQRFFSHPTDWLSLNILLLRTAVLGVDSDSLRYVLAFDEVVRAKAGKQTYGVNWFYSSIAGRVIRSVSCHAVSLVDTKRKKSYVLTQKQTVKAKKGAVRKKNPKRQKSQKCKAVKKKSGRPKGSKNKQNVKKSGLLYESFEALLQLVTQTLLVFYPSIKYVLADGAYGNKTCCLIVREFGLHLISKLNRNTALFLPYGGEYGGKGRKRKYGEKLNYKDLSEEYLIESSLVDGILTKIYQVKGVWTRQMPTLINVVIIVKTDTVSQKTGRVVLFSTDLNLSVEQIIEFYSSRFQIEFNFRDAKQYFGLADFKNIKQRQVENAVGLAFFTTNVSNILIEKAKEQWQEENLSIQDLKAFFRAEKYLENILNTLQIPIKPILNRPDIQSVFMLGAINRKKKAKIAG